MLLFSSIFNTFTISLDILLEKIQNLLHFFINNKICFKSSFDFALDIFIRPTIDPISVNKETNNIVIKRVSIMINRNGITKTKPKAPGPESFVQF